MEFSTNERERIAAGIIKILNNFATLVANANRFTEMAVQQAIKEEQQKAARQN